MIPNIQHRYRSAPFHKASDLRDLLRDYLPQFKMTTWYFEPRRKMAKLQWKNVSLNVHQYLKQHHYGRLQYIAI